MAKKLLLTVEDTFILSGQGLIILPSPYSSEYSSSPSKLKVMHAD